MSFVLLHGLGADRGQPLGLFGPVLERLGVPAAGIVAPDVRAHGASTLVGDPADFAIDRIAREVAAEAGVMLAGGGAGTAASASNAPAARPLTLIGISMGAALALRICLLRLLPVERAVFVRPAFGDRSLPPNLRPFPVIGELLRELGAVDGAERFRHTEPYLRVAHESPAGGRGLLAQFRAPDAARRAVRLVEIPRNRAFAREAELGDLASRGIRTLVVGAPRDPVHPFALAERWAGALGSPLERVPARDDGQAAQDAAMRSLVGDWLSRR
ncbi:alpha/beta fold hydrolase [Agromyces aurantiacus]|uniref:Alpha/beta fold hydrolase n=1 Tax=Agromyces aurantiacus TaxID=165814 RepID=A0ABV9R9D2_9MICO|nr:alpha/beta fold hydrolase [Agromyces aurantiacus]MBM7503432.1 pimeloyl-ACP methyl ester carboxylesterase [Agromyces aurantiacus]